MVEAFGCWEKPGKRGAPCLRPSPALLASLRGQEVKFLWNFPQEGGDEKKNERSERMRRGMVLVVIAMGGMVAARAGAVEPWADPELKVTDGLEVWLDASVQDKVRMARWQALATHMGPLGIWYDGSGHGRQMTQPVRDARPRFVRLGERAAVRFDGKDDFLS